jgi:hypothetical protein
MPLAEFGGPAHSAKTPVMMALLTLEEEHAEVLKQIEQIGSQETASDQWSWRLGRFARKVDLFARPWILQFK